jgi:hypothetical protein
MNRCRMLLLALAAVASAAEAQCTLPFEWVPGRLLVSIAEASLDQLDSEALLRGEPRTGLASLDTLIARTGVLAIEPFVFSISGSLHLLLLYFPESTDVCAMEALYARNEHVYLAEADYALPTAARATPWFLVKRPRCGSTVD